MIGTGKYWTRFSFLFYAAGLLIVGLILAVAIHYTNLGKEKPYVAKEVDRQLVKISTSLIKTDSLTIHFVRGKSKLSWKNLNDWLDGFGQVVVIKKDDSLIYWNHSDWPVHSTTLLTKHVPQLITAREGWFMGLKQACGPYQILLFYKVQNNFNIHNGLLINHLNNDFSLPQGVKLVQPNSGNMSIIKLESYPVGIRIFNRFISHNRLIFFFFLFILAYVLLFLFIEALVEKSGSLHSVKKKWIPLVVGIVSILVARYIDILTGFPGMLKHSFLFSEAVCTLPGFKTLGSILLNLTLLLVVSWKSRALVYKKIFSGGSFTKGKTLFTLAVVFLINWGLLYLTTSILTSYDQQFSLSTTLFSNFGLHDLLFFAFLGLIIYLLVDTTAQTIKYSGINLAVAALFMILLGVVCGIIFSPELKILLISWFTFLLLTGLLIYFSFEKNPYLYTIFLLLVLATSGSFLFNHAKQNVRNEHQKITASLLAQRNDPYFEFQFRTISREILKDSTLRKMLATNIAGKENLVSQYIEEKYFKGRFVSYTKQFTLCQAGQQLQIQPGNQIVPCDEYFSHLPGKIIQKAPDYTLSLISNNQENIYYLATFRFPAVLPVRERVNLYIEFFADFMPKGVGYPELLVDTHQKMLQLSGYSFSRYFNGVLQYKFGDFPYPVDYNYFKGKPVGRFFFLEHFKHIIIKIGAKGYLVVSRPQETVSMRFLPFSALFLFFSFLVMLFIVVKYGRRVAKLFSYSFRARLQLVFFASVLAVFLVLSFISFYYFKENGKNQVNDYLREKSHSVLIALQQKLEDYPLITKSDQPEIQDDLQKLSQLFFSDINLYNRSGILIASSRPEIFENGLQSVLIHPGAYDHIRIRNRLFYLSMDHIGSLSFYSAYMPFTLMNGKDAGILNLPYFARQGQIQKSGYQMLANLLSLFVITGILGLILILYLSKIMTKPLMLLQEKINLVSIEKQNEKIVWQEKDEIGQLIAAYNQMVEKLEQSAELLKHSERERAWGEMARQITHEIRNPLTPMKLNVQYLLKAYQQKDKNFDEKLKNISQTLINQIDALNEVAGMFSDFSKTALPKNEKADLLDAIKNSIALFKKSYQIEVKLMVPDEDDLWVWASTKSLMRIFNNLSKNAVQAMEQIRNKRIEIEILPEESNITVRFTDFGKGIAPENKRSIFQPYFTTKSTGTGLGLAIVKNMMEEMEGTVSFESKAGKGTSFYLKFRRV